VVDHRDHWAFPLLTHSESERSSLNQKKEAIMEKRESFASGRSFPETCQYLQTAFFPRLKEIGVGPMIQLLSPRIVVNESRRFGMMKVLEKRMILKVEVTEDNAAGTVVTVMSSLDITMNIIATVILGLTTCGLAALIFVPLILVKKNRWEQNVHKAVALLKADLAAQ
jgi:hypothetical protein